MYIRKNDLIKRLTTITGKASGEFREKTVEELLSAEEVQEDIYSLLYP